MRSKPSTEALQRLADEDLMTLVDEKDPDAFAVLYDRHGGAAYLARPPDRRRPGIVRGRHAGGVPLDLAQQRPLRRRARERSLLGARASSATARSTRSAALRDPRRSSTSTTRPCSRRSPPSSAPTTEAIRRETAGRLRRALGLLPREQSQVIELAYFGGFSHSEIAEMLGAPLGTIKGRMRLGLEKIRTTLAEGFPDGDAPGAYL